MLLTLVLIAVMLSAAPSAQRGGAEVSVVPGRRIGASQITVVSGSLTGTVRDQSRALVAGIQVTVTLETEANVRPHRTTTDLEGRFRFTRLPLGTYCLTVNQPRVGVTTRTGIRVRGAQATNVPVVLGERPPAAPMPGQPRRSCSRTR